MYYESIRTLLEEEFDNNNLGEEQKYLALDILNKLSENFDKITRTSPIYLVAAIAFFALEESGQTRNFKQLGQDFGVEAKTIAMKVKEVAQLLNINNQEEIIRKGLFAVPEPQENLVPRKTGLSCEESNIISATTSGETKNISLKKNIPEEILKTKRPVKTNAELNDQELIILFKQFKTFVTILFKDKDYIEIKQFLRLLELNLYMSGYDLKALDTEKKFGDLFIYLGFEPKKGREAEKFVHLKDRFGQSEPYSLIKLGE